MDFSKSSPVEKAMDARYGGSSYSAELRNVKRIKKPQAALCFKVPVEFRRWFKRQALLKDMTMTKLLIVAAENYLQQMPVEPVNTEIRK